MRIICSMMLAGALVASGVAEARTTTITTTVVEDDQVVAPVLVPMADVSVAVQEEKPKDPPPPPEPTASDAENPRKLVRYFCRMWKDENYEAMYWAMTPKYRKAKTLKQFQQLFEDDAEITGGLSDENMTMNDDDEGKVCTLVVDLKFNNMRAKGRRVKAQVEKTQKGYRLRECGLLPVDMNDL